MTKKPVSDASILFDLEFRGIDSFLSNLETGLGVPECFVDRVSNIVQKNYGIALTRHPSSRVESGHFCLMPYTDQREIILSKLEKPLREVI